jgi:hypothetical protein
MLLPDYAEITVDPSAPAPEGQELGRSRDGRPVVGYRLGRGPAKISLLAGCHADEPVGPILLRSLAACLSGVDGAPLLRDYDWWIIPDINPDGAERNRHWSGGDPDRYDLSSYLEHAVREPPGDDVEFGFPRNVGDTRARPENRCVYDWWRSDPRPFDLHVSLHGMGFAGGPWFLIDPGWRHRCGVFKTHCRAAAAALGYALHDVQRNGEKGFERIERGFCTRPNSAAMARFFRERGDPETAAKFRPSSMETIRTFGGDALTLVTEIPLFVLPGVGERIEPSDPVADSWRERIGGWKSRIARGESVAEEITESGVRAVPLADQFRLQWETLRAGAEQVNRDRGGSEEPQKHNPLS